VLNCFGFNLFFVEKSSEIVGPGIEDRAQRRMAADE